MNIEKILNKGINILQKNKIANPKLDSEILLSNSIKRDKKHIILNPKEILTAGMVLFAVIDIIGNIPIIISLRKKSGHIQSGKASIVSCIIMIGFLFFISAIITVNSPVLSIKSEVPSRGSTIQIVSSDNLF